MTLVIVKVAGKIAKQFAEENYIHVVYINFKIGGTVIDSFSRRSKTCDICDRGRFRESTITVL